MGPGRRARPRRISRTNHYRITGARPLPACRPPSRRTGWKRAARCSRANAFYPEQPTDGELVAQLVKSSPSGGSRSMHQMLLMSLASATQNIRIGMAYFRPRRHRHPAARWMPPSAGVEVDIIVPGPHISKETVRHGSRHFWGDLLEAGIRIHEFQPTMYHAKIFVIDEDWVSIGSANFDVRSFRLNDEANLNVFDRGFALQHIAIFEEDLAWSRRITLAEMGKPALAREDHGLAGQPAPDPALTATFEEDQRAAWARNCGSLLLCGRQIATNESDKWPLT